MQGERHAAARQAKIRRPDRDLQRGQHAVGGGGGQQQRQQHRRPGAGHDRRPADDARASHQHRGGRPAQRKYHRVQEATVYRIARPARHLDLRGLGQRHSVSGHDPGRRERAGRCRDWTAQPRTTGIGNG
uniref:(northern house mosquito) hypothetical protein n=1 Tax=Culex pipiens TaxID=7175 RepID=A0A8D8L4U5_CULPI